VLNYRSGEAADHLLRWPRTAIPTMRLVDELAVPSGYLVDVFAQFELVSRSISNFVDADRFSFRARTPLRPIFLSNRNLEPLYNVKCVLQAFAIIQQRWPDAKLIVAGDGSERSRLERIARALKLRNVEFTGRVPPEKMPELYDAADVYLNSPNIDNMPGSIIEAFASGLPVVTTDAGGIPYLVEHQRTGLMASCGDYREMAALALRLLADHALAMKITNNARQECERYRWDAVKNDWLKLYRELDRRHTGNQKQLVPGSEVAPG
jgi:glycosyltransferase involved in cell wall biosynthesis